MGVGRGEFQGTATWGSGRDATRPLPSSAQRQHGACDAFEPIPHSARSEPEPPTVRSSTRRRCCHRLPQLPRAAVRF